ncbi:MAG: DNA adenine methylase [Flavobacteriaceae bacterium]|nr:MAG: DNA adenine methylase [Flavobacteriaceae bacterium]
MTKTPIAYYGGKQSLLNHILPLIPKHKVYTEPFFGGGAVFFAKKPVKSEIINDTNNMVVNFYEVVQTDFEALKQKIEQTPFSRTTYAVAHTIYRMPHLFSKLAQAWAFYVATNMGFSTAIGSWGYDKYGKRCKVFQNKKMSFDDTVFDRLQFTEIECNDACKVITSRDSKQAFHYVDPPYIDTDQGHYSGYTRADYRNLLETLSNLQGKFLLSSYASDLLTEYTIKNEWHSKWVEKPLVASLAKSGQTRKRKTEVLTANYPL